MGAVGATLALTAFAWVALRRLDAVVLAVGSPMAVFVVEKLLKQVVLARQSPGSAALLYPSGHLAVATALALTAVLIVRLARPPTGSRMLVASSVSLLVLLGRARLAETAHLLSDVVGGVATGVAVTLAVALLLDARSRPARRGAGGWRPP